jgi:5-oxoprolinase (ATP-hydrolysing)/N-methylhydantoinase A
MGGGQGGSARGDGKSGLLWPTSAANTSIELFETRVPVLVLEKTYLPDSGGPGRHRGGLGQRVRLRKLADDGLATLVAVYPEGVNNIPEGLFGGHAGGAARGAILDAESALVHDCGTGELVSVDRVDRIVEVVLAGGAGYGDPRERNRKDIEDDIANGRVTAEGAQRDYGTEPASLRAAE